ncbi:protein angel homolog 2 [Toxorhynchites rutilus septentrionalis]|uniref:protein angel homolog 2 n=1 Tax=Toxorhynchites rutilus septentrionalis TaxID=329112 RepID=UPI00247A5796|nr:protein angel homolog 2 [Toxorhynchites rutilus septentrionalis]
MKRIFRTPLIPNLTVALKSPLDYQLTQFRSFKRMYRSRESPRSKQKGPERDVRGIFQRYARQRNMSETCRNWRSVQCSARRSPDDVQFNLMSYNILAQDLLELHEELYDQHDAVALSWSHRYDRLMAEINLVQPDILCVQELQENHKEQFSRGLANFKYDVIYKKRTGDKTDGCAIYFKQDVFELLEYQDVEYYQPDVKRLDRENVAIIAKFGVRSNPNQKLVVATTHLLYNPRRQDIRLAQIQVLLAELDRLAYIGRYENGTPKYLPTIVTGDFNLQPYTAPYVLLTTAFLQYESLATNTLEPQMGGNGSTFGKELLPARLGITDDCRHENSIDRVEPDSGCHSMLHNSSTTPATVAPARDSKPNHMFGQGKLRHRFKFTSAYKHNLGEENAEATTFQGKWITVDFLFYTKFHNTSEKAFVEGNLKLVATYSLPTVKQAREIYTIPNMYFGSDHFALAGRFLLKNSTE